MNGTLNVPVDDPSVIWSIVGCAILVALLVAVAYRAGKDAAARAQQTEDELRKQHTTEWPNEWTDTPTTLPVVSVKPYTASYKPAPRVARLVDGEVIWQSRNK